jgi:hypothetical protein
MTSTDSRSYYRQLKAKLTETGVRIRRYTLHPNLRLVRDGAPGTPPGGGGGSQENAHAALSKRADDAWAQWIDVWGKLAAQSEASPIEKLGEIEGAWLKLDREVDLLQRELVAPTSRHYGVRMVIGLAAALVVLVFAYLLTHGVRGLDFTAFEPWPESGPLKYGEVVFWSLFGVLCYLIYLAADYLKRRDFDEWYVSWYLSTALRAPFLSIVLMMIVLEFSEWYGEGTWIQDFLLEEGNKYYFIVFTSFCLGLAVYTTSEVIGGLAESVGEFFRAVCGRVSARLGTAVNVPVAKKG